ncbi:hypothetical protein NPIL_311941 [Nephila pilipes]|uniref:Uncharacterized protein n=1 Tax=Nephila pilipes TaxID=299642 RepID=A0A8X6NRC5_NEPPI|nr:hypothetical protein NPIL_311941 [Nephila pilipes]
MFYTGCLHRKSVATETVFQKRSCVRLIDSRHFSPSDVGGVLIRWRDEGTSPFQQVPLIISTPAHFYGVRLAREGRLRRYVPLGLHRIYLLSLGKQRVQIFAKDFVFDDGCNNF